jgi:hypothetical protein
MRDIEKKRNLNMSGKVTVRRDGIYYRVSVQYNDQRFHDTAAYFPSLARARAYAQEAAMTAKSQVERAK